jgi:hypothetical protein
LEPDKPFSIRADNYALLELVPPHRLAGYRLRIQIHHDGGERDGHVGVYFGYSMKPTAQGLPVHCFAGIHFNDIATLPGRPPEQGNEMRLSLHLLYSRVPGQVPDKVRRQGTGVGTTFQPAGLPRNEPWRTLQIEVEANEIRIRWDKEVLPTLWRTDLNLFTKQLVADSPVQPRELPQFLPQEALGVYLFRASAWFRSCSIEALPDPQPEKGDK